MKINKYLSKYNQSSRYGETPKYIVMHYVGGGGAAKDNCHYFAGGDRQASAHFFCDNKGIWQCIPISRSAWHCGGGLQDYGRKSIDGVKGARLHTKCKNSNSIGIELCCSKTKNGWRPTKAAIKAAIPLVRWLMKKYGIRADHVIRHWDVTGKQCPAGYLHKKAWANLHQRLTGSKDVY